MVLPAVSGTELEYRLTWWSAGRVLPAGRFQYEAVTTGVDPVVAALLYQSGSVMVPDEVIPSVWVTETGPVWVALVPASRKASADPSERDWSLHHLPHLVVGSATHGWTNPR
jgi:hypothetical protein